MILEIGEMLQNFLAISGDELLQMKANEIKGRNSNWEEDWNQITRGGGKMAQPPLNPPKTCVYFSISV